MKTDELIEQIHDANMQRRLNEHSKSYHTIWRIAIPAAAAAAILLIILLPHERTNADPSNNTTYASAGI